MNKCTKQLFAHLLLAFALISGRISHIHASSQAEDTNALLKDYVAGCKTYHLQMDRPSMLTAAQKGDNTFLQALLGRSYIYTNLEELNASLDFNWTYVDQKTWSTSLDQALIYAIDNAHLHTAELLLRHGACPHTADSSGCNALIKATQQEDLRMVLLLLQYGAHINQAEYDPDIPHDAEAQPLRPTALNYALPSPMEFKTNIPLIKELAARGGRVQKRKKPSQMAQFFRANGPKDPAENILDKIVRPLAQYRQQILEECTDMPHDLARLTLEFSDALC